ncbi:hypothetical protein GCM10027425_30190 [Alteromonas gracilis]
MAPNIVGEQTMEAPRRALTPAEADIAVAKAAVRARLDGAATHSLIEEVLSNLGITPPGHNEHYEIRPELEPDDAVDADDMQLKRSRMTHATKLAIAVVNQGWMGGGADCQRCGGSSDTESMTVPETDLARIR